MLRLRHSLVALFLGLHALGCPNAEESADAGRRTADADMTSRTDSGADAVDGRRDVAGDVRTSDMGIVDSDDSGAGTDADAESRDAGGDADMDSPSIPFELGYRLVRLGDSTPSRWTLIGDRFVVFSSGEIIIYDVQTGSVESHTHETGDGLILWAAPDSSAFAALVRTLDLSYEILIWDEATRTLTPLATGINPLYGSESPDKRQPGGFYYAVDAANDDVLLIDFASRTVQTALTGSDRWGTWDPMTGRALLQKDNGLAYEVLAVVPPDPTPISVGFTRQYDFWMVDGRGVFFRGNDAYPRIWDFDTMEVRELPGLPTAPLGGHSAWGTLLLTWTTGGDVFGHDLANEALLFQDTMFDPATTSVAPGAKLAALGRTDSTLAVHRWDVGTRTLWDPAFLLLPAELSKSAPGVAGLIDFDQLRIWSPAGDITVGGAFGLREVARGSDDGDLWIYSKTTGTGIVHLPSGQVAEVAGSPFQIRTACDVAFADDGTRVAFLDFDAVSGRKRLHLWTATGGVLESIASGVVGSPVGGAPDCDRPSTSADLLRGVAPWADSGRGMRGWEDTEVFDIEVGATVALLPADRDMREIYYVRREDGAEIESLAVFDFAARTRTELEANVERNLVRRESGFLAWGGGEESCGVACQWTLRVDHPLATNGPHDVHVGATLLFGIWRGFLLFRADDGGLMLASPSF